MFLPRSPSRQSMRDLRGDPDLIIYLLQRTDFFNSRATLLELGCGAGMNLNLIKRSCRASTYGIDENGGLLGQAGLNDISLRLPKTEFRQTPSTTIPFDNWFFDVALTIHTLQRYTIDERVKIFDEVRRVLRPGGLWLVVTYSAENLQQCPLTQYWPQVEQIDLFRYPSLAEVVTSLEEVGFGEVYAENFTHTPLSIDELFFYAKNRGIEVLDLLDDQSFKEGLEMMRQHLGREVQFFFQSTIVWAEN